MRLIDADKLKEELSYKSPAPDFDMDSVILGVIDEQPTVNPWHRVEEPPEMKETKELPGFFMSGLCALFDRYSKVFDLGYATRSNYMGGGIKWHSVYATRPTHWMPIEFPIGFQKKEDA